MNIIRTGKRRFGERVDDAVKYLFGGTAMVSVVVLGLITLFLFREGAGFFPENGKDLRVYRHAGLEYVDFMREQIDGHLVLSRRLQELRLKQLKILLRKKSFEEASVDLEPFDAWISQFDEAGGELRDLVGELTEMTAAIRDKVKVSEDAVRERAMLLQAGRKAEADRLNVAVVDYAQELAPVRATFPAYRQASVQFAAELETLMQHAPATVVPSLQPDLTAFGSATRKFVAGFSANERKAERWDPSKPVPYHSQVTSFLFGTQWITNSFWQDMYGVLPLVTGSLMVSAVALMIAIPLGTGSALYVSEMAGAREQRFIKPFIEFISAIPSVVLGFFGIAVLGETVRWVTQLSFLSWVPFFPVSERLNVFTAGSLLALMAIPTIFSLSEDALNNVPRAYKEASYALGATRVQTMLRVLVPASLSGIISAILLGFGRVIGETMVVLLCAGNRIAIPNFTEGAAVFFQPVHTMTGIIAQEMGEVVRGSIHYRALFMVGLLLFFLSLAITFLAQFIVRRFKISIG